MRNKVSEQLRLADEAAKMRGKYGKCGNRKDNAAYENQIFEERLPFDAPIWITPDPRSPLGCATAAMLEIAPE